MLTADLQPRFDRIIVMGVSGCGKSTLGAALATALGARFVDGDDLHPAANIAKMAAGQPLNDADRGPWLHQVGATLRDAAGPMVIGCSALRRKYRDQIIAAAGAPVAFVHLSGSRDVLLQRMQTRPGHFMPAALLDSQLATLEPPTSGEDAVTIAIDLPLDQQVRAAVAFLA